MADNEAAERAIANANEWEVVSLTASAYAASPGPKNVDVSDGHDKESTYEEDGMEPSEALFMSRHFVVPSTHHDLFPQKHDEPETQKEHKVEVDISQVIVDKGGRSYRKDDDVWDVKGLTLPNELPGLDFLDDKGMKPSLHSTDFQSSTTMQGLNLLEKEQNVYNAVFSSYDIETDLDGSTTYEINDPRNQSLDSLEDEPQFPKPTKEEIFKGCEVPSKAWWKRKAASLYVHTKEANALWSVFIAATVMGLVILGQRWQQERWQALQLKSQFTVSDEKMSKMMGPVSRLKYVIIGGHPHGSFLANSASVEL